MHTAWTGVLFSRRLMVVGDLRNQLPLFSQEFTVDTIEDDSPVRYEMIPILIGSEPTSNFGC